MDSTIKRALHQSEGCAAGIGLACVYTATGAEVAVHEVVGHGYVGGHLTYSYLSGDGPHYQVDGWDNFKAIFASNSPSERLKNCFHFFTAYDRNHDGALGKAWVRHGEPNAIGEALGAEGQSAWVSLSGSLPGLALNAASGLGGIQLVETHPFIGCMLITFALTQHLFSSCYPIDAAMRSTERIKELARMGHDFANLAVQLNKISGIPIKTIALIVAATWTASVPTVMGIAYAHKKSKRVDRVPDSVAHTYLCQTQPGWQEEVNSWQEKTGIPNWMIERGLITPIPRKELNQAKVEILEKWSAEPPVTNVSPRVLLGPAVAFAAAIATLLSHTIPIMRPIACGLQIIGFGTLIISVADTITKSCNKSMQPNKDQVVKTIAALQAGIMMLALLGAAYTTITNRHLIRSGALITLAVTPLIANIAKERAIGGRYRSLATANAAS